MQIPIVANTATDAIKKGFDYIKEHGVERTRYGGTIPEKLGVGAPQNFDRLMLEVPFFALELRNPRARWTNIGNNAFITLAEQEDHMAGRNPGILPKYSKTYREWFRADGRFPYSYGLRLLAHGLSPHHDQIEWAVRHLLKHPNSRKCVITISDPVMDHTLENPPCNIAAQLEIIDGKLNWTTFNRSQDLINGLSENIFMFTLWQEEVLRRINEEQFKLGPDKFLPDVEMGLYRVISSNTHLYQKHMDMDLSNFKEPYHCWSRDAAPKTAIPTEAFNIINSWLFEGFEPPSKIKDIPESNPDTGIREALNRTHALNDPWWRAWKGALVAEWAIIQGRKAEALDALELAAPAPWAVPVAKRLMAKFSPSRHVMVGTALRPMPQDPNELNIHDVELIAKMFPQGMHDEIGLGGFRIREYRGEPIERVR